MDRTGADFDFVVGTMKDNLKLTLLFLIIQSVLKITLQGVIDIVNEVEYHYDKDKGVNFEKKDISPENKDKVAELREILNRSCR